MRKRAQDKFQQDVLDPIQTEKILYEEQSKIKKSKLFRDIF